MLKIDSKTSFLQRLTMGLAIVLGLMLLEAAVISIFTVTNVHRSLKLSEITQEIMAASEVLDLANDATAPLETVTATRLSPADRQKYETFYSSLDEELNVFEQLLNQQGYSAAKQVSEGPRAIRAIEHVSQAGFRTSRWAASKSRRSHAAPHSIPRRSGNETHPESSAATSA